MKSKTVLGHQNENRPNQARTIEHILIVGAGLAGLTLAIGLRQSGYQVTVLERATQIQEIGAGIQLPANSYKVLSDLGVLLDIEKAAVKPSDVIIRSYRGEELYVQNLNPTIEKTYGKPHLLVHRADIHRVLFETACDRGVRICLGAQAVEILFETGTVVLANGDRHSADLVVGCDGEHSICREALLGRKDAPRSSGDVVFRVVIPLGLLEGDALLKSFIDPPCVHAWYEPNSHAVAYQSQKDGMFNVVLTLPETEGAARIGSQPASLDELRVACRDWDPRFRKMLDLAPRALKWTLLQTDELPQWHHDAGKFVLLGDSAHAVLPYLAQGAALALESAHFLSTMLAHKLTTSDMPSLLAAYASQRIPRARATRQRSKAMHDMCQLEDGPGQIERDRAFREDEPGDGFPNPWADPGWQRFMWGLDCGREARTCWERWRGDGSGMGKLDGGPLVGEKAVDKRAGGRKVEMWCFVSRN